MVEVDISLLSQFLFYSVLDFSYFAGNSDTDGVGSRAVPFQSYCFGGERVLGKGDVVFRLLGHFKHCDGGPTHSPPHTRYTDHRKLRISILPLRNLQTHLLFLAGDSPDPCFVVEIEIVLTTSRLHNCDIKFLIISSHSIAAMFEAHRTLSSRKLDHSVF